MMSFFCILLGKICIKQQNICFPVRLECIICLLELIIIPSKKISLEVEMFDVINVILLELFTG